jgi:hypothetical protein
LARGSKEEPVSLRFFRLPPALDIDCEWLFDETANEPPSLVRPTLPEVRPSNLQFKAAAIRRK